jgi:hypothetical protein
MDWLDIVKLSLPAAICACFLGLRAATGFLIAMVALTVYGLGFWLAANEGDIGLGMAFLKVAREGTPIFGRMMSAGAAGIVVGWWLRTWIAMVRSSRKAQGSRLTA